MARGVTKAISTKSHQSDPFFIIDRRNVLPKLNCAAFSQACKVNFEIFRFAIAGAIFLSLVTNDSNHLHEIFSGRDHFENLRVDTISNLIVLPIRRHVFHSHE